MQVPRPAPLAPLAVLCLGDDLVALKITKVRPPLFAVAYSNFARLELQQGGAELPAEHLLYSIGTRQEFLRRVGAAENGTFLVATCRRAPLALTRMPTAEALAH